MLNTVVKTAPEEISPSDVPKILKCLLSLEWTPAIFASKRRFFELAGLCDQAPREIDDLTSGARRIQQYMNGDLFFKDGNIFYILANNGGESARQGQPFFRPDDEAQPELEIGLLTQEEKDKANSLLDEFATSVENAVKDALDGRKTRYMEFDWVDKRFEYQRIEKVLSRIGEQSVVEFNSAELSDGEIEAAEALVDEQNRETLRNLSRAGFARESDVIGNRKDSEQLEVTISRLVDKGLLDQEYLLECKQTGSPLTRLDTPGKLENQSIGGLKCASCGSVYKDENLSKGYLLSDLGRELISSSHWMEVWVTQRLVDAGIALDSIYWNMAESGEEIDIVVDILGQLWIFELKDREFGAGDAYPLNYRQARYGADKIFIITTENVSKNAKRVFEEAVRESRGSRQEPVYIEGLDKTLETLEDQVNAASVRYASHRLRPLAQLSGFDIGKMLAERLDQPAEIAVPQADEVPF